VERGLSANRPGHAKLIARELNRLSDRALQQQTREWLQAYELLVDSFETSAAAVGDER
jgi:hypothetical protein